MNGSELLRRHLPPDLVVFDVDGTLHDTFRWWAPVIRDGLRAFRAATGVPVPDPSDEEAEAVVGMRDAGVWGPFLPEAHKHRWQDLRAMVIPMEVKVVRSQDFLFQGVRELLLQLRAMSVKVALASNCRSAYMAAVQEGQGLAALSDWQYCLDSPGIADKTGMLASAARVARARRPVMVGDREPDRDAARALGWPFVWRTNRRCRINDADATWCGDPEGLLGTLGLRGIT